MFVNSPPQSALSYRLSKFVHLVCSCLFSSNLVCSCLLLSALFCSSALACSRLLSSASVCSRLHLFTPAGLCTRNYNFSCYPSSVDVRAAHSYNIKPTSRSNYLSDADEERPFNNSQTCSSRKLAPLLIGYNTLHESTT